MGHTRVMWCGVVWLVWTVWAVQCVDSSNNQSKIEDYRSDRKCDDNCNCEQFVSSCDLINRGNENKTREASFSLDRTLFSFIPDTSIYERSLQQIKSPLCRRDVGVVMDHIRRLDIWALKMLDSTGRMTSGLLNGNVNQLGDFDQCLAVNSPSDIDESDVGITPKYCLAYLDVKLPRRARMDQLVHSYGAFVSNISDPGHRVARFSTVSWGFCLPATCSARDLEKWIVDTWSNNTDVTIQVRVEESMCYTTQREPYSFGKIIAIAIFCSILAMTCIGTTLRVEDNNNKSLQAEPRIVQLLLAFSLRKNLATLFSTNTADDDIRCLHGVRALSAVCLIIFHKSAAILFNPYVNKTAMAHSLGLAWSVIGRTAIIYTDSFILLSGLLTSYIFIKELDKKGKIDVKDKYWTRFFRIAPNLVAVILFCTYIMVDLGSGPQWNLVVKHHSDLCKQNMWRNLLFIHNYFGFENMCLTHTHQLGIDMQLFVVSPLIVWLLWRHLKTGAVVVTTLAVLSTVLRYTVALDKQLSPVLYFGASVTQMFDTANLSYILPSHRATVYLMGVVMGYFLRRYKNITLNKFQVTFFYVAGFILGLYALIGPYHMARRGYQYSALDGAHWNAYAPIMWSTMICCTIIICANGYGGYLNDLLTWRGFVVFTRLGYGVYITQFPVFFYNVGTQRTAEYYTPFMLVNMEEVLVIFLAAISLTLLVDLPFQEIKKITWRINSVKHITEAAKEAQSEMTADSNDNVLNDGRGLTKRVGYSAQTR